MEHYEKQYRERVISYIEAGHTQKEAAKHFGVGTTTISRWLILKKKTGSLKDLPPSRPTRKLHNEELMAYVKEHPDAYLSEIAEHFKCATSSVYYALKRLKITYKKSEILQRAKRKKTTRLHNERKENFTRKAGLH